MNRVDHSTPYRPRRTLLGSLLSVLLVAAWLVASGVLGGAGPGSSLTASGPAPPVAVVPVAAVPVAATSYVIQPGDTLWTVARGVRPSGDVRPLVDQLARQTDGRPLRVGQRISLP